MILIACVLLLCFAGVLLLKPSYDRRLRRTALLDRLPGPPPPPSAYFSPIYSLVGHIPQLILPDRSLMESILVVPEELNRQYGQRGIFKLDTGLLGGGSVVVLTKAHTVEPLLRCAINIRKDDTVYGVVHDWWGDGIIASDGDKWHRHRKLLTPAFHFKILQDFLPIINKQSDILIKKLIKSSESGQQEVDMIKVVSFTMLDTIAETSMGIQLNSQTTGRSAYHESIQVIGDTMVKRAFGDLKYRFDFTFHRTELGRYYRRARDYLISFTRTIIEERKKSLIEEVASKGMEEVFGSRRAAPLMNVLLKHHLVDGPEEMKLSVKNVLDETQHFLIGALDTSTYTISWVLYLLAINPDHQRLVHEELDAILGDEDQTAISKDQLSSLTYLEMCIKETLRIYPTVSSQYKNQSIELIDNFDSASNHRQKTGHRHDHRRVQNPGWHALRDVSLVCDARRGHVSGATQV